MASALPPSPLMLFLTLNVCGLRDINKRLSLMQWLSHLCLDVGCVQEIYTVSGAEAVSWFSPFGSLRSVARLFSLLQVSYPVLPTFDL